MAAPVTSFPRALLGRSEQARLAYFATYTMSHALIAAALEAVLRVVTQPADTWTSVARRTLFSTR